MICLAWWRFIMLLPSHIVLASPPLFFHKSGQIMAKVFDGMAQELDFSSCGDEGSSSDSSDDDWTSRIVRSPSAVCRTPRMQRHRSRSITMSPSFDSNNPIPYVAWRKLRLCDSPSTPKVECIKPTIQFDWLHHSVSLSLYSGTI